MGQRGREKQEKDEYFTATGPLCYQGSVPHQSCHYIILNESVT